MFGKGFLSNLGGGSTGSNGGFSLGNFGLSRPDASAGLLGGGIGSLLGDTLGSVIPFGGLLGGVLDGFLSGGKTSPSKFLSLATDRVKKVMDDAKSKYSNDYSAFFTTVDYNLMWLKVFYEGDLADSTSSHSKEGNTMALGHVDKAYNGFLSEARNIAASHNGKMSESKIEYPLRNSLFSFKIKTKGFRKKGMDKPLLRVRRVYEFNKAGAKVQTMTKIVNGIPVQVPVSKSSFNPLMLLIGLPVGLGILLYKKLKN